MANEDIENVDSTNDEGEGADNSDSITLPRGEYDKLKVEHASFKREIKDLKKPKDEPKETPQQTKTDDKLLERVEKMALRQAQITEQDDIDLARGLAKKWNMDLEEVLLDEDFKSKLQRQQDVRANIQASSKVKGSPGISQAKNEPAHWIAKGTPPTPADIPDKVARRKVVMAMIESANRGDGRKFYND